MNVSESFPIQELTMSDVVDRFLRYVKVNTRSDLRFHHVTQHARPIRSGQVVGC